MKITFLSYDIAHNLFFHFLHCGKFTSFVHSDKVLFSLNKTEKRHFAIQNAAMEYLASDSKLKEICNAIINITATRKFIFIFKVILNYFKLKF